MWIEVSTWKDRMGLKAAKYFNGLAPETTQPDCKTTSSFTNSMLGMASLVLRPSCASHEKGSGQTGFHPYSRGMQSKALLPCMCIHAPKSYTLLWLPRLSCDRVSAIWFVLHGMQCGDTRKFDSFDLTECMTRKGSLTLLMSQGAWLGNNTSVYTMNNRRVMLLPSFHQS